MMVIIVNSFDPKSTPSQPSMFAKTLKSNIELISLKHSRVKETCEEQREKERIKQTSNALAQVMGTRN